MWYFQYQINLCLSGDGGWAGANTQWSWTQENCSKLQFLYQPHEAVREETQTLHQQIQVGAFVSFSTSLAWASCCVSVAACVWERVSMFMSFDAVQMFHGLVSCAGVCSPCKRQGMWRLTEECYSSSSFLQWRLCFSSLILCFASLSPPVGHISNWKPSIICSLRYVCLQALNNLRLKDLNNFTS